MRSLFHVSRASGLTGSGRAWPKARGLVSDWLARRRSRRTLAALDPHMLRDIGLTMQDAQAERAKPFWRD